MQALFMIGGSGRGGVHLSITEKNDSNARARCLREHIRTVTETEGPSTQTAQHVTLSVISAESAFQRSWQILLLLLVTVVAGGA